MAKLKIVKEGDETLRKVCRPVDKITPRVIPQAEGAIAWDDPDLGIDWKISPEDIILSAKDTAHPRLKDAEWLFDYNEELY